MKLGPAPKRYFDDGQRTCDPATTLKRIEPLRKVAGVTRVADITRLDRVGKSLVEQKAALERSSGS